MDEFDNIINDIENAETPKSLKYLWKRVNKLWKHVTNKKTYQTKFDKTKGLILAKLKRLSN
jgi:hypothetical protein